MNAHVAELVRLTKEKGFNGIENFAKVLNSKAFSIVLRKTRANFFAATEPISIPAGSSIALSEIRSRVHTESSVAGTWDFDASAPTTLNACIWTLKATFTPANLELCEIITVEIPVNITAE